MKLTLKTAVLAGLSFIIVSQVAVQAQTPPPVGTPPGPAAPTTPPTRANGLVTVVNGNSLTVHDRRSDSDIAVTVTPDTKFSKVQTVGIDTLAVGNFVRAGGREEIAAGTTTVDAAIINVLPELPTDNRPSTRDITGTIVTTTPTLTVKTADGTVYTVNTTADTQVDTTVTAALTDVAVGTYVQVRGKNDGTTFTATEVHILPARKPRAAN